MRTEIFMLPTHWACALINGDTSGMSDEDEQHLDLFISYMVGVYGACWCLGVGDCDGGDFRHMHDASEFGVLACDVAEFTFDISDNK